MKKCIQRSLVLVIRRRNFRESFGINEHFPVCFIYWQKEFDRLNPKIIEIVKKIGTDCTKRTINPLGVRLDDHGEIHTVRNRRFCLVGERYRQERGETSEYGSESSKLSNMKATKRSRGRNKKLCKVCLTGCWKQWQGESDENINPLRNQQLENVHQFRYMGR